MGYLCAIGSAVLYGIMPLLAKEIYAGGGSELTVVAFRFLTGVPFLFLLTKIQKISLKITVAEFRKIFFLSQGLVFTSIFLFLSYSFIPAGMSTTIHFIYPTLVLVIEAVAFREKLSLAKGVCAFLGLFGVVCFYVPNGMASGTGILLAFASAVTYSFYVVYDEKSGLMYMNSYTLCFYVLLICGLEAAILAIFSENFVLGLTWKAWSLMLVLSFATTVLSMLLVQTSLKWIGAEKTSFLSTFEPLTSVILGIVLLGEQLTVRTGFGIACILSAAVMISLGKRG